MASAVAALPMSAGMLPEETLFWLLPSLSMLPGWTVFCPLTCAWPLEMPTPPLLCSSIVVASLILLGCS